MSRQFVQLQDHTTEVHDSGGEGVPAVLIHALSMDHRMWDHGVFDHLASHTRSGTTATGPRVIAYDMRGHSAASDAPRIQSLHQLAEDLKSLLHILGVEKADIAGVSFGGAVAQTFALSYPEVVRSVALIATTSTGSPIMADRATQAEAHGVSSMVEVSLSRWFLPQTLMAAPECVRYALDQLAKTSTDNWAAAWRAMSSIDCLDRLGELQVPVLLLAGTEDTSTPPDMMRKMYEACTHGDYREVGTGMHFFVMENPGHVARELAQFLDRVQGAA